MSGFDELAGKKYCDLCGRMTSHTTAGCTEHRVTSYDNRGQPTYVAVRTPDRVVRFSEKIVCGQCSQYKEKYPHFKFCPCCGSRL